MGGWVDLIDRWDEKEGRTEERERKEKKKRFLANWQTSQGPSFPHNFTFWTEKMEIITPTLCLIVRVK